MKNWSLILLCLLPITAFGQVHVRANTTSKGTYRPAHQRTAPDHTQKNNYSSKGNSNPYTGKKGTKRVTR